MVTTAAVKGDRYSIKAMMCAKNASRN